MGDRSYKTQMKTDRDHSRLVTIGLAVIPAVFVWFIFTALIHGAGPLTGQLFFGDTHDTFMDFYNCLHSVAGRDPYNEINKVQYPPLCELIFYVAGKLAPRGYDFANSYYLREVQSVTLTFVLFIFVPIILSVYAIEDMSSLTAGRKRLLVLSVLLSSPFLYSFERGNIILYSLAFTLLFISLRNSESKVKREIALICLALAFAIKIYPAAFGVLLLREKKIKEAVRCALYALALFFLPFLCFGGFGKFMLMIKWLTLSTGSSTAEGLGAKINFATVIRIYMSKFFGMEADIAWPQTVAVILAVILIACSIFVRREWMSAAMIALVICGMPAFSYFYVGVFLIIPFVMLTGKDEFGKADIAGLALLLLALAPYPVTFKAPEKSYDITVMQCITGSVMLILSVLLIAVSLRDLALVFSRKELLKDNGSKD